jgi:hypothetical protein
MITQLNPYIPLDTPKGAGQAFLVIDYGQEQNLMWVVAIDATGEIWTFQNQQVRAQKNITMGRIYTDKEKANENKNSL